MAAPGPQSPAPRRSRESNTVGNFTKLEEIGKGSFATVYKAVHVVSKQSPRVSKPWNRHAELSLNLMEKENPG